MIQLIPENIHLNAPAATKEEVIRAAGQTLVKTGNIEPAYIESMLGREEQANTFLGNGIAIPHGMGKDRELIHHTGVCVLQLAQAVEWGPTQNVRLVIGIAAKSDEHLGILAALTDLLDDPAVVERLAQTDDPAEIMACLNKQQSNPVVAPREDMTGARETEAKLCPGAGLHARPAANFVAIADGFTADIRVGLGDKVANGKAMASLLKLGAPGGAMLTIMARGADADAALAALKKAVEEGLGDEEEAVPAETRLWVPEPDALRAGGPAFTGVCASPGIAIGPLRHFQSKPIIVEDTPGDPELEETKLRDVIADAKKELQAIYDWMTSQVGKNEAAIFRAQEAFLGDPELFTDAATVIKAGHGAAWAWQQAIAKRMADVKSAADSRIAGRAADLYDVGQRVLRLFVGAAACDVALVDEPCILIADDLTPSDTAKLDPERILGFVTVAGGPTSHTAIIARSLGIPAVVGTPAEALDLAEGSICILNGTGGGLYSAPSDAVLESARQFQIVLRQQREEAYTQRYYPALMTDGHRVEVVANIGSAADAAEAIEAGAEGVGLLRTEFLFLDRETAPTEDAQFEAYSTMIQALGGLPLITRTLDIGGDKVVPYLALPEEDNPFLGVRGIRLCLKQPDIFLPQLRAIYRASRLGPVKIMFPMVATLAELRAAKEMAEQVRIEIGVPPVEIGIMIEVPSSAVLAATLAQECDFFSIGTNDLTQYTLAMDRLHPVLGAQADGLHPAVLRLIEQTVRGAQSRGKWVGACGGIAGDPLGATILAGLGVTELSMSTPAIADVKAHLRGISLADAQALARQALACTSAAEVHALNKV